MKANKIEDGKILMIDDLVVGCIETDIVGEATYKILCKVTDINHYGDVRCEALKPFPDELDWQDGDDFSWIEPIPLTPEILEKNGFRIIFEGELHVSYFQDIGRFHVEIKVDKVGIFQKLSMCDGFGNKVTIIECRFVHQLQHALNLCGIEKEIEL